MGTDTDPREIVRQGLAQAQANHNDYVLIDTAGRLQIDEKLMQELADIKEIAQPDEILLVVDAMTGQAAVDVAKGFNEQLDITGVVLTKLDGDTRGGAALSIRAVTGKPIKFTGQGEKMDALDVFYPDRMANRILGMGDILTLVDKAQKNFDEKEANKLAEKIQENSFDFNDFIAQMDQVTSMGPMEDLLKMIPGMANNPALKNFKMDPKDVAHMKAIVMSMTEQERVEPDVLNPSRRRRIAAGSGRPVLEVNRLIKQFNASKKMMNQMTKGNMSGMEQMMGGGVKGRLGKMAMNRMMKQQKKNKKKRLKNAKRFKS
jgi:signal recognition particle subunit SRP54